MASSSSNRWMVSSSMASSKRSSYDVFLSFRGEDVRKTFLGHLYTALVQKGIYTYKDDKDLRTGEQISPALMKAIEESQIAIVVFSENYASSAWCLEELAKIMECEMQRDLTVFPVFYKVDPREVRTPRTIYKQAIDKHLDKFMKDLGKVERWEKALSVAGNLSGRHFTDGDESELIQSIVNDISTRLAQTPLYVAKHPVGINPQVAKLKSMLNLDSNNDVVRVGLWGQGGIGKTTLAKALYNSVFRQFEGSCFLENVRENSKCLRGLVNLQEILLKNILQQRLEVSCVGEGINLIERILGCKKVLLILDDVDDWKQFEALVGQGKFGDGSMIIITTRNKQLLTCCEIDQEHVYEVRLLQDGEALELLCGHAFRTPPKSEIKEDLVYGVLKYAKGLPLALVVLGSSLHGKGEEIWEHTLKKLSTFCENEISEVLKISYDGLGKNEREIFVHIVCFFKGRDSEYVKKVLDNCDLMPTIGLEILEDRSLISTKEYGIIKVHDLIQAMGIEIVNQENDPGRRTKLWMYDDVKNVLQRHMGDCAVEAIVLELPEPREIYFNHDAFRKMGRLKLLILHNVHNSFRGPIYLPNDLRWIELTECNWRPEFSSSQKGLAAFFMNWWITRGVKQFEEFRKLKHIILSNCNSLVSSPDISCTPNLEKLRLEDCKSLVKAHRSNAYHDTLQVLSFVRCPEFRVFPKELKSKNLRRLACADCPKFDRFPDIPHKLEGLTSFEFSGTSIKNLPTSIENLVSLEKMILLGYENTVSLPCTIYKLQELRSLCLGTTIRFPKPQISGDLCTGIGLPKLTTLELGDCMLSEVEFLEDLSCFPLLRELWLSRTNITSLPTSISKRDHLSHLYLDGCCQLQEIPELPLSLELLDMQSCESLEKGGYLTSIDPWVRRASLAQDSFCRMYLNVEEMPEWFQRVEGDSLSPSLSFMASKDLHDKFLGLVFWVARDYPASSGIHFKASFEGESWNNHIETHFRFYSHCRLIAYLPPSYLWKVVDFGRIHGSYAQFSLELSNVKMKMYGVRIICKQLEDHLKAEIRDNQLIDLSLLHEVGNDSTNPEAESSHMHEDSSIEADQSKNLQDCHISTNEHNEIVPKRDHELSFIEACEPRSCPLLIRLMEMSMAMFGRCFCCRA